jgi:hypothetical protein
MGAPAATMTLYMLTTSTNLIPWKRQLVALSRTRSLAKVWSARREAEKVRTAIRILVTGCVVLAFSFLCCGAGAQASPFASEEILDYHSDIRVRQDASLLVTETILVRSAAVNINHGIYRDFPTRYKDPLGNPYVIHFEVVQVLRDGRLEKFQFKDESNGKRIYIGDENVILAPGDYTYALTYTADREIGFFADHDELYWNVTGTGWLFRIAHATATVTLPENIPLTSLRMDGYTGPQGARGKDFSSSTGTGHEINFACTHPLAAGRGSPWSSPGPRATSRRQAAKPVSAIFLKTTSRPWWARPGCVVVLPHCLVSGGSRIRQIRDHADVRTARRSISRGYALPGAHGF